MLNKEKLERGNQNHTSHIAHQFIYLTKANPQENISMVQKRKTQGGHGRATVELNEDVHKYEGFEQDLLYIESLKQHFKKEIEYKASFILNFIGQIFVYFTYYFTYFFKVASTAPFMPMASKLRRLLALTPITI